MGGFDMGVPAVRKALEGIKPRQVAPVQPAPQAAPSPGPVPPPIFWVREKRPDQSETTLVELSTDDWTAVEEWIREIATWKLQNRGTQTIEYGYRKEMSEPDQLNAGDFIQYDTSPTELWARRTSSASSPSVHLEYWCWNEREPGGN